MEEELNETYQAAMSHLLTGGDVVACASALMDLEQRFAFETESDRALGVYVCGQLLFCGQIIHHEVSDEWSGDVFQAAARLADRLNDPNIRCCAYWRFGVWLCNANPWHGDLLAEPHLKKAVEEANKYGQPQAAVNRFNAHCSYAEWAERQGKPTVALHSYRSALNEMHVHLPHHDSLEGIEFSLASAGKLFQQALHTATAAFRETGDRDNLWHGLEFVDSCRAVAVREGLRRLAHTPHARERPPWKPGPIDCDALFSSNDGKAAPRAAVRGAGTVWELDESPHMILRLPEAGEQEKVFTPRPFTRSDLADLLPDDHTVLVSFFLIGSDLYVLPVRRGAEGKPALLHERDGYFTVGGARAAFESVALGWRWTLDVLRDYVDIDEALPLSAAVVREELAARYRDAGASENLPGVLPDQLFSALASAIDLKRLLNLIEPDPARRAELHLVLLPDGPLYQLPIHAARVGDAGTSLIDQVGSVRYALSLTALKSLTGIECEQQSNTTLPLKGVAFVNPASQGERPLPFAPAEAKHLVEESAGRFRIFGEISSDGGIADRANLREHHGNSTLLWIAAHGGLMEDRLSAGGEDGCTVINPAMLLCDGPVSTARMVAEAYDFRQVWLMVVNACVLGGLKDRDANRSGGGVVARPGGPGVRILEPLYHDTHQVEGFVAAVALVGLRRVTSYLWNLDDRAAAEFGRCYIKSLSRAPFGTTATQRGPHAFAVALKEAVAELRKDERFDHEYFWAGYTMYGLG